MRSVKKLLAGQTHSADAAENWGRYVAQGWSWCSDEPSTGVRYLAWASAAADQCLWSELVPGYKIDAGARSHVVMGCSVSEGCPEHRVIVTEVDASGTVPGPLCRDIRKLCDL